MKRVYISRNYKSIDSAGGKAKTDVELILQNCGFRNIGYRQTTYRNKIVAYFTDLFGIIKACICMPGHGILFMQYPLKKYFPFVCYIAHFRNTKVVSLIHDLGSFRRKKLTEAQEIKRLGNSDYLISANYKMTEWLKTKGYKNPIGNQQIWDYFSVSENNSALLANKPEKYIVNYAGALNRRKNSFLYDLINYADTYIVHLYGSGFNEAELENQSPNFQYKGFKPSEDLIKSIDGDFGLVWDGDSTNICSGNFGSYLQYNNPHKVSLYIRCHLPVIIWKDAALASFIDKHKAGFCIESLDEISSKLSSLSIDEYNLMKQNVIDLSLQLKSGFYLEKAINEAIEYFSE